MPIPAIFLRRSLPVLLLISGLCTVVRAQLDISRQVIGSVAISSTPPDDKFLKFTATAGEPFIGRLLGDVQATVGFQQPDKDIRVAVVNIGTQSYTVTAFPNPTSDVLFVRLDAAAGLLTEVQLYDPLGREVRQLPVTSDLLRFPHAGALPAGPYFLRASDRTGHSHQLGTIIVTQQ